MHYIADHSFRFDAGFSFDIADVELLPVLEVVLIPAEDTLVEHTRTGVARVVAVQSPFTISPRPVHDRTARFLSILPASLVGCAGVAMILKAVYSYIAG